MTVPAQPGLAATIESPAPVTNTTNGAQSPAPSPAAFQHGATGERTFTAEDIAKARKEEKDKLYGDLTSIKEQFAQTQQTLKELQDQRAQELAAVEQKRREKESKAKADKEEEMSAKALLEAKLKETNDTWEERFNKLQTERDQERALATKEREYNELVDYRNSQLQANANDIAPQFHNFIAGESKEQIDNAIAQAKAATQSIFDEVAAARQQQQSQQRGVSTTGYTALGPLDGSVGQKTYTAEDINAMSMAEYAKFRADSGLAGRDAARSAGLFG
jgi:flagellar biosynthesis GTPase FlhF